MKSFLQQIEEAFEAIDKTDEIIGDIANNDFDDELDEMSTSGGAGAYMTPNAFSPADDDTVEVLGMKRVKESINKPATYSYKDESPQSPESDEEVFNDKFPFAPNDEYWWQNDNNEYPTKFYKDGMGTNSIKDTTTRIGNLPNSATPFRKTYPDYLSVHESLDAKYEQLIESYRNFKKGDVKPSSKVKRTIQEIATKLREIEQMVGYNSRLKTEAGVTSTDFGPATKKALNTISERLIKISERVRALGE